MKVSKVLYFVLGVMFVLMLISLLFPKDGVKIGKDMTLYFPTLSEMFVIDKDSAVVDIKAIVNVQAAADSMIAKVDSALEDSTIEIDFEELKKYIHSIEFPNKTALNPFFEKLTALKSGGKKVRLMHYGDSQIEGDRITSFLRSRLQGQFGGYGIGLIPIKQPYDFSFSIKQTLSENWWRYTIHGKRDTNVHHSDYGPLAAFTRFTPVLKDSNSLINTKQAWFEINKSNISYAATKSFKTVKIFYANCPDSVGIAIYSNEVLMHEGLLKKGNFLQVFSFSFPDKVENMKVVFKGKESPDFYGITLESPGGIIVDNIGLRGSSGTIFTKINASNLKGIYDQLDVDMFILQFGGNVMPYIDDEREIKNFADHFYNQLVRIKSIRPDAVLIVIGPSDMSIKKKDKYVTYDHLEKVRDALKESAFKAGACYWDLFEAMGGRNSMPAWVEASPALAAPDYTHFTANGVTVVSNMFYNALMLEYNNYLKNHQ